jgi:SAM-dependent methyltransferase
VRGHDYFLHRPGEFTIVRCMECGLLYQNPQPTPAAVGAFYPDEYGSYTSAGQGLAGRRGLIGKIVRRGFARRCALIDQTVPPREGARRLLDIGCASGLFLEAMQQRPGWQVEGVELHEQTARAVSRRLGIPVFAGPFEAARYPDRSFDALTLWDVLEHLHDPLASLREMRRILRPGGVLFIRVPNAASYLARLFGRYWVGYDLPRHMTIFTPRTLAHMLARAGFGTALRCYYSGSYLAAMHSLHFLLEDGRLPAAQASALHRALLHPALRALAFGPAWLADRVAGGAALEVLVC